MTEAHLPKPAEAFAAEILGAARAGDVIAVRCNQAAATALAESTASDLFMDKDITLLVFPAETTAVIVPGGDDPAYAAHRAEIEQAILDQASTWEREVGGQVIGVSDAATVAALHTWPTYVASAGAHALLADYEEHDPEVVVHQCPADGEGVTPCCGRTPFELPLKSRMAIQGELINCTGRTHQ